MPISISEQEMHIFISKGLSTLAMPAYWGVNLMAPFLFLGLSPTPRAYLFCVFTLIFHYWTLVWVWSCHAPPAIPALPLAIGEWYYFVVWSATLWSIAAELLGETPGGGSLVVVGLSSIASFVCVVSMVYRQVLAENGPKHLQFNTPPVAYAVAILEFLFIGGITVEMADLEATEASLPPPYFKVQDCAPENNFPPCPVDLKILKL